MSWNSGSGDESDNKNMSWLVCVCYAGNGQVFFLSDYLICHSNLYQARPV